MLRQETQCYDMHAYDFVAAAEAYLGSRDLARLHASEPQSPAETPPTLQRAQVQAQLARAPNKHEKAQARKRFKFSAAWEEFVALYRRFVHEVIVPQWGVDLLYQASPVLRVVLPGSVAPCKPHCDADYFHDSNEINYWLPMTKVWGSNTLWSESAPGAAYYAPFELEPGQLMRFYGNRCAFTCLGTPSHAWARPRPAFGTTTENSRATGVNPPHAEVPRTDATLPRLRGVGAATSRLQANSHMPVT